MHKPTVTITPDYTVVMDPPSPGIRTPCSWLTVCPSITEGKLISCNQCPAAPTHREMSHEDAVEWWEDQNLPALP